MSTDPKNLLDNFTNIICTIVRYGGEGDIDTSLAPIVATDTLMIAISCGMFSIALTVETSSSGSIEPILDTPVAGGTATASNALVVYDAPGLIFAFVIIFGSLSRGFVSVWPAACVDIAGSEQSSFSNIMGFFCIAKGIAAIIGPLVATALHHPERAAMKSTYRGYGLRDITLFMGNMMVATAGGIVSRLVKRVTL
ncbi:Monocarboxylate transporter 3 [Ceratobasidium theobromae]|uniref:Monocarboxylate transporter 3 n=1 Tax=Ceratobasidium theobromae TaxID=1582974 RepID=A0A5N5Q9J8_9AGAM|nr:Monocarboxylate transporter 3 [Ceratobasidium theobromae]